MMAALDDELSGEERQEWEALLAGNDELRREWNRLNRVKEVTDTMAYRKPPEEVWERYWGSVYNQAERGTAWMLVSVGALVLIGYGLWEFVHELFADTSAPPFIKYAVFSLMLGGAILLFSVIREKLFTRGRDPYKEVQR